MTHSGSTSPSSSSTGPCSSCCCVDVSCSSSASSSSRSLLLSCDSSCPHSPRTANERLSFEHADLHSRPQWPCRRLQRTCTGVLSSTSSGRPLWSTRWTRRWSGQPGTDPRAMRRSKVVFPVAAMQSTGKTKQPRTVGDTDYGTASLPPPSPQSRSLKLVHLVPWTHRFRSSRPGHTSSPT